MTAGISTLSNLHDAQVALEVAKRAELGYFNVEFTVFGCAYVSQGQRYYRLSANDEKIYDFIEKSSHKNLLPTDLITLTKESPVPIGMREEIALEVKQDLARKLSEEYPLEFFSYLEQIAEEATENTALPFLEKMQEDLNGNFDEKGLKHFEELLESTYLNKKITYEHFNIFEAWLKRERKNMEETIINKDIFEKTFYGIAFVSPKGIEYITNACKGNIYKRKYKLEMKGIFTTPIYSETYYYNYNLRLPQVQKKFELDIKNYLNNEYITSIMEFGNKNTKLQKSKFEKYLQEANEKFGESAQKTLKHYGYRWGIF